MFYVSRGNVPHKRHTQHRAPDGSLYAEELFGMEGFTGRSSLLYHRVPPTRTHHIEKVRQLRLDAVDDGLHRHRLVKSGAVDARGNVVEARIPLFFNSDVVMGVVRPTESLPETTFYRNGEGDEMLFVHEGTGTFDSIFGPLRYGPGDYIVIPIGTTWRLAQDEGVAHRILYLESPSEIVSGASCLSTRRSASATSACLKRRRHGMMTATS
jgi:homogentisate 1,2-dioxygenase